MKKIFYLIMSLCIFGTIVSCSDKDNSKESEPVVTDDKEKPDDKGSPNDKSKNDSLSGDDKDSDAADNSDEDELDKNRDLNPFPLNGDIEAYEQLVILVSSISVSDNLLERASRYLHLRSQTKEASSNLSYNFFLKEMMLESIIDVNGVFIFNGSKNINKQAHIKNKVLTKDQIIFADIVTNHKINELKITHTCSSPQDNQLEECKKIKRAYNWLSYNVEIYIDKFLQVETDFNGFLKNDYSLLPMSKTLIAFTEMISKWTLDIVNNKQAMFLDDYKSSVEKALNLLFESEYFWESLPTVLRNSQLSRKEYFTTNDEYIKNKSRFKIAVEVLRSFYNKSNYKIAIFDDVSLKDNISVNIFGESILKLEKLLMVNDIVNSNKLESLMFYIKDRSKLGLKGLTTEKFEDYLNNYKLRVTPDKGKRSDEVKGIPPFKSNQLFEEVLKSGQQAIDFSRDK